LLAPLLAEKVQPMPAGSPSRIPESSGSVPGTFGKQVHAFALAVTTVVLSWIFYATAVELIWLFWPLAPFPRSPTTALQPFRIANRYGLFAVMKIGRASCRERG